MFRGKNDIDIKLCEFLCQFHICVVWILRDIIDISIFFDKTVQCLNLVTECKKSGFGERLPIRIIWYDAEGRPAFSINRRVGCERARDVGNVVLRLPPGNYTINVDLP